MINTNRIVPIQKTDLLTLFGGILAVASVSYTVLASADVEGTFTVGEAGTYLANQPVKTLNFTAASGTVYFVAAYDFGGIAINGVAAEATVKNDGATIYKAVLADGAVTVTAVTPAL